jgi:teichuronic acid biosynthesis glycosyltransferase TuaH
MAAAVAGRDVLFAFFGSSWAHAARHGFTMPDERLAEALTRRPEVRRLLVANPYRSVAGRVAAKLRGRSEPQFPERPGAALHEPLRLRRTDPVRPERAVARYEASLRRAATRLGLERPAVITSHPLVAGFGSFDWAGPVTYYGWDDWTGSEPHRRYWPAYEEAFARMRGHGRRACAVSAGALERIAPSGPSAVIPNGIEPAEWRELGAPPAWFAAKPAPRLLYVGTLDGRLDAAQARQVAEAHPEGSLTFVGTLLDPEHFAGLRALPNVEVHAPVPREEVVRLIGAADACVIPHVRNQLTEAMSPLKLYEYLAGGRPVAAVELPPIAAVRGRVALAPPAGDLRPALERALAMGPAPEPERQAFVAEHAWQTRFDRLLELALAS